jgi:replication initiation and membrane attachment protein DnaB
MKAYKVETDWDTFVVLENDIDAAVVTAAYEFDLQIAQYQDSNREENQKNYDEKVAAGEKVPEWLKKELFENEEDEFSNFEIRSVTYVGDVAGLDFDEEEDE